MGLRFVIVICFITVIAGCSHDSSPSDAPLKKSIGLLPTPVTWNHKEYKVTTEMVYSIGMKLGESENSQESVHREVYQIIGTNSSKEIAIHQLSETFFRAISE